MTDMITIYGVSRSRASRNIWLLNELGQPFNQVPVIQVGRVANPSAADAPLHSRHPEFLKINPNGHVPSLKDGDLVLHESLAMNLYIARKYGGPLSPQSLAEEGLLAMWTLWSVTEVEPHSVQIMYHRMMKPVAERDESIVVASMAALRAPFAVLEAHLATSAHIMGERFTVADINVAEVVRYALSAPELMADFPAVKAWITACHARPAYQAMMDRRNAEPA